MRAAEAGLPKSRGRDKSAKIVRLSGVEIEGFPVEVDHGAQAARRRIGREGAKCGAEKHRAACVGLGGIDNSWV